MRRVSFLAALIAFSAFGSPLGVSAQTLTVTVASIGGVALESAGSPALVNAAECADTTASNDTEIVLNVSSNAGAALTQVYVWANTGSTNLCQSPTDQQPLGTVCAEASVTTPYTLDANQQITVRLGELIAGSDANDEAMLADFCAADTIVQLFVTNQQLSNSTSTLTGVDFGIVSFSTDLDPPNPVTIVGASDGLAGDSVRIDWTPDATEAGTGDYSYLLGVADTLGCTDASGPFTFETEARNGSEATINVADAPLNLANSGDAVYVTVRAIDLAGNEGDVAIAPICVTRIPTAGFCALYEAENGRPCPDGCSVSAVGRAHRTGFMLSLLLSVPLLLLLAFRLRSQRA